MNDSLSIKGAIPGHDLHCKEFLSEFELCRFVNNKDNIQIKIVSINTCGQYNNHFMLFYEN